MKSWMQYRGMAYALLPLSGLYGLFSFLRKRCYQYGIFSSKSCGVPVIVVGNITVGGTGKTPTIIALCDFLKKEGYRPGVVSRGYEGRSPQYPLHITENTDPRWSGDEPRLIYEKTACPVVVDPSRGRAAEYLVKNHLANVILSDDGLQHLALKRDVEIVLVNEKVGFGNGWLLPAGPLREPLSRLKTVDFVLYKSKNPEMVSKVDSTIVAIESILSKEPFQGKKTIHAVAGIAFPEAFFEELRGLGFSVVEHAFPDHYDFTLADFKGYEHFPIIMTEKDEVKCRGFAKPHWYVAKQETRLPDSFLIGLKKALSTSGNGVCHSTQNNLSPSS